MNDEVTARHLAAVQAPVLDTALLDDIADWLERYVDLPSRGHALILATYCQHTWMFDAAYVTPYLYISSSGPASGKTRLCDVMSLIVRNADTGTDSPVHVLAQEIAANCPTLFFDEIDTVYTGRGGSNIQLRRVLNIGYQRGAVIKRQRGNEVQVWAVFCAKVLAGIRNNFLPAALLSRCIPIEMKQRGRELERFNKFHLLRDSERQALVDRMAALAEAFTVDVLNQRPDPIIGLSDRENEITEPLLAIASTLGRERELRDALRKVFSSGQASVKRSREQVLLERIRAAFDAQAQRGMPTDRIFSEDLCRAISPRERQDLYSQKVLSILLAEMGFVRSGRETIRIDTQTKRGYMREDFEALWLKYLDPVEPVVSREAKDDDDSDDDGQQKRDVA